MDLTTELFRSHGGPIFQTVLQLNFAERRLTALRMELKELCNHLMEKKQQNRLLPDESGDLDRYMKTLREKNAELKRYEYFSWLIDVILIGCTICALFYLLWNFNSLQFPRAAFEFLVVKDRERWNYVILRILETIYYSPVHWYFLLVLSMPIFFRLQ